MADSRGARGTDGASIPADQVEAIIARRVEEEIDARIGKRLDDMLANAKANASNSSDLSWVQALSMQLASLIDQGTGQQKRLAPEELKAREDARERMFDLIMAARERGETPAYRLTHTVHLPMGDAGETKIPHLWIDPVTHKQVPTEIEWPGVPNQAMQPLNDPARAIHEAFTRSIGGVAQRYKPAGRLELKGHSGAVVRSGPYGVTQEAQHTGVNQQGVAGAPEGARLRGRQQTGEMRPVNILGTIARPAQQQA